MAFRKLRAAYALASLLMVTAGAITIAFSIIWRAPDLLKNFVITSSYLTGMSCLDELPVSHYHA
jgi:hypothetical protein